MTSEKFSTQFRGVRYRKHNSRKHNGHYDRYFFIRYKIDSKLREEGVGWASEGWNANQAFLELADLKKAHKTGEGPQTLAERRALEQEKRELEETRKKQQEQEAITFGQYFEDTYLPEAKNNKAKDSWRRENNLFELWIKPVIGKMPFKNIRPFNLERIKKNMSDAMKSNRSIQYALAVVRQVFNHAVNNEIYKGENPTRLVRKPKVDNKRMRFLTHQEADNLLNKLKTKSQNLYNIALVSLHSGLRAGEIFNLTWGCVDWDNLRILIMDTKSGKNRTVYMTQDVKNMFSSLKVGNPTDLVFKDKDGKRIKQISNSFDRAISDLGFNNGIDDRRLKVTFHSLRHTFASWLVQHGVDLYTVKELLGHSTLATTERYSHLAKDTLRNAVSVFEKSIENSKDQIENGTQKENHRR